jgi:hypothetical protein
VIVDAEHEAAVSVAPASDAAVERDGLVAMPRMARHHQNARHHFCIVQTNASRDGLMDEQHQPGRNGGRQHA